MFAEDSIHESIDGLHDGSGRSAVKQLINHGLLRRSLEQPAYCQFTHALGYQFARNEAGSETELRRRLANWIHNKLTSSLAVGSDTTDDSDKLLQHASALLRTDHDQQLWIPLANYLLYDGCKRMVSLGRLARVNAALSSVLKWLVAFPDQVSAAADWVRERSVSQDKLGDLAVAQGNLSDAQDYYSRSLAIAERLAESDLDNAEWQRDLSVSLEKLGDLAVAQGNLSDAQDYYSRSLAIFERLAESDSDNAAWQRDLSVSLNKLGDLAATLGNLNEAQEYYSKSIAIAERLAESDSGNAAWQRDLWVSCWRIANLLEKRDDPKAIEYWKRAHDILAEMQAKGLFVSENDKQFFDGLAEKVKSF